MTRQVSATVLVYFAWLKRNLATGSGASN